MIELENGYVIIQTSSINWALRQKYTGIRNGVECECLRHISHHNSLEDAVGAFVRLFPSTSDKRQRETLEEFLKRFKSETERAVESVNNSMMQRFFVTVPKAKGDPGRELPIIALIPIGRDNAISRKDLLNRCIGAGLIEENLKSSDRRMRALISDARKEGYTILNLSDGDGYYQLTSGHKASLEDIQDLQKYIKQEESRAKATFKNISMARKLYEDYVHDRF